MKTHQFFMLVLWIWSCSQHSHSRPDHLRADWLFSGQKPASCSMAGDLNFLIPFAEPYSGESCKHFSYCNLKIKTIQISHFRIQRTNHNPPINSLKLLWAPCTAASSFLLKRLGHSSAWPKPRAGSQAWFAYYNECFSVLARGG